MSFSGQTAATIKNVIKNISFFPALDCSQFVTEYNIPLTAPKTIKKFVLFAMIEINRRLKQWMYLQKDNGFLRLSDMDADNFKAKDPETGEIVVHELEFLYFRAVFCKAKAFILRDFITIDRRDPADDEAKSAPIQYEEYERWSQDAINLILGVSDVRVELI